MNYFELFGIPLQFQVNKTELRKKFFELSKHSHPDYFVNTGTGDQEDALEASASLNSAFKTLSSKDETLAYILTEKGLLAEGEKYSLPQAFLMQMLEMNEELADQGMKGAGNAGQVSPQVEVLQKEIYEPVKAIIEGYREGVTTEKELLQVKEYYFKKKYLQRLAGQMGGM